MIQNISEMEQRESINPATRSARNPLKESLYGSINLLQIHKGNLYIELISELYQKTWLGLIHNIPAFKYSEIY